MEIRLVAGAGFCFGVKRAVDTVYEQIQTGKTIYTYGSIVNNEVVVKELTEQGVHVIESREELERLSDSKNPGDIAAGTIIIRAHGVPREVQQQMERKGWQIIDATCPFVKRIHRAVEKKAARESTSWWWAARSIPRYRGPWDGATARWRYSKPWKRPRNTCLRREKADRGGSNDI